MSWNEYENAVSVLGNMSSLFLGLTGKYSIYISSKDVRV